MDAHLAIMELTLKPSRLTLETWMITLDYKKG
jgi:hypothetical protein